MKAKFIFEKFAQDSDPIKDMGIGVEKYYEKQLGLEKGEFLNDIFRGKKFWNRYYFTSEEDHLTTDPPYMYEGLKFFSIKQIRGKWCVIGVTSDEDFKEGTFVAYPVNQFFKKKKINEKFVEDSDPIHDMGIGMKHIIKKWFLSFGILEQTYNKYITINDDYSIDVNTGINFSFYGKILKGKFPDYIKFNKTKRFDISKIKMKTLKGCPEIVDGDFYCNNNLLESLDYCPKIVTGNFVCYNNKKHFTKKYIREKCRVGRDIKNNEY